MKLVIDIPKDIYEKACRATMSLDGAMPIYHAIKEGTPLPKGHGRLIDADAELEGLRKMMGGCSWQWTAEEIEEVEEGEAE